MDTTRLPLLLVLCLLLIGCGAATPSAPVATATTPPPTTPPATVAATPIPLPTLAAVCIAGPDETWVEIDARSNLFGAGIDNPPAPAGGGAGVLPPLVPLPSGGERLVTFSCTDGLTNCCAEAPDTGPNGDPGQSTEVASFGGIAGMLMARRAMFLAGVFLTDEAPVAPAPERLDFSDNADFEQLSPEIDQTFFIGDGKGRTFVAPDGATRLYLGFVDAFFFSGQPGWYGNNRGALEATVAIAVD